jgi:large subunit ribosomal protein L24
MFIRVKDVVEILTGDDRGKRGEVISVDREKGKVVVQGINLVYRHMKARGRQQQGGRLSKEMGVDASNVALIDPSTNKPTRVGVRYLPDGTKELYAKSSGTLIRTLSKPRPQYAKKA